MLQISQYGVLAAQGRRWRFADWERSAFWGTYLPPNSFRFIHALCGMEDGEMGQQKGRAFIRCVYAKFLVQPYT